MAHTFRVDDVETVRDPLAGIELEAVVAEALGVELIHVSHRATLLDEARHLHPLLQAVHVAFAQHRPLSLSPDHVWLTITQGFAIHVDQHAEELRARIASSASTRYRRPLWPGPRRSRNSPRASRST